MSRDTNKSNKYQTRYKKKRDINRRNRKRSREKDKKQDYKYLKNLKIKQLN